MDYFRVANWETLQHYKDRSPPWIKLHNSMLDDYEFSCLQDASKAHLFAIMMLASRTDNKLPINPEWIKHKISATCEVDIASLLESGYIELIESNQKVKGDDSKPLAERLQVARPEERREEESREEDKRFAPPEYKLVHQYMIERNYDSYSEAESFVDFYQTKNWMVGKNKMKDWKAAVRNWLKKAKPIDRSTTKTVSELRAEGRL